MTGRCRWSVTAPLLTILVALALATFIGVTDIGRPLEDDLHSMRDAVREHRGGDRFALVEIDANSLRRLDRWPWPRRFYAQAIARLGQAGANAIAFDIDFSSRSDTRDDDAFAHAIARSRIPTILPTFRQYSSSAGGAILENLPIPKLLAHAQLAAVNIAADRDGLVRHYPFGIVTGGTARPSVGAMLAGATGRADTSFAIDGAIDPQSFPRISFVDLIEGHVPPGLLQNRAVLIGATAIELGDRYSVPRYGVIPGPVIQLLAADTLASGSSPTNHGPALPIVIALAALLLAGRARELGRIIGIVSAAMLLLTIPLICEAAHIGTVDIVPGLAGLLGGAALLVAIAVLTSLRAARLTDTATGLPNRRGFQVATARLPVGGMTALRITNYSDAIGALGQGHGVDMIQRVLDRLTLAGVGQLYRLEESVLAWIDASAGEDARVDQVEGLAALLRAPVEVGGRPIELRCRFGLASGDGQTPDLLADQAILAADHAGESGTIWERHSEALGATRDWLLVLAGELDHAMTEGHIWIAYQPKLDIRTGRIDAAEALVRWTHPERGAISPDAFIPALEASGRILDLTLYMMRQAAADAQKWRATGNPITVAINVSALLTTDRNFLDSLDAAIDANPLFAEMITLEVTESAALSDPTRAVAALDRIAARGIKLSIDDYGTGQSTLTYLKQLPAREIKIDKSFVLGLETSASDQAMVRSTIDLAHELGFSVVAEGVETAAVLDILAAMGCDVGQGWHIGRPMPAEAFTASFLGRQAAA